MDISLVLENNKIFHGKSFGAKSKDIIGEIVFQTGMVGYPESLTDPSYKDQILVLTYPLIGNYGVPSDEKDEFGIEKYLESNKIHIKALVVGKYINNYNHWNAVKSLDEWLKENNIPGIYDVDTREITKIIRNHATQQNSSNFEDSTVTQGVIDGTILGRLTYNNFSPIQPIPRENLVDKVSIKEPKIYNNKSNKLKIVLVDCGIKNNQLRSLLKRDVQIKLVPWNYDFTKEKFDRLMISNGPGDPKDCQILIERVKYIMNNRPSVPIFGICLGHQILALAVGCDTYKMKYGNRGHNIPAILVNSKRCYITSQNHGYAVETSTIPDDWQELFINGNDKSNEGIIHKTKPYFSVQFHPEARAGPEDTDFLFDLFLENKMHKLIQKHKIHQIKKYRKVLILGSGGLSIGQSGEFDYSGSQAIKAYKEENMRTVLINPNIATVQTSPGFADKVYFLPVTKEYVTRVIKIERPDCIALSFGGQTALNCGIDLYKSGILEKYSIDILGTPIETIIDTEDRERFQHRLEQVNEETPKGYIVKTVEEGLSLNIDFPLLVRAGFALGGLGSGFAHNKEELKKLLIKAFSHSDQVIIDKSLKGWKEVEYEIVRDSYDNCISVCNMENLDPLGIHTGESIVVAPSQTLDDHEYNMLRSVALKTIRHLKIVGECNIQYALNPNSREYFIIEINARLSRSSALASKATGYPLAYIAAKLSLGYSLTELNNKITENTIACFEPSLDYCVVKVPRWDLEKFPLANTHIDSSMKSIGEAMAISRNFTEAFQKALRMSTDSEHSFDPDFIPCTEQELTNPTHKRIFAVATALYHNIYTVNKINRLTGIDKWFLYRLEEIINMRKTLENSNLTSKLILYAKKLGYSDNQIAIATSTTESFIRQRREQYNIYPKTKRIDTVACEFPCTTNYLYTTYNAQYHDIQPNNDAIIVLGSGVYKIGSSVEFDWCIVNCIRELRKLDKKVIIINCNPETVSTDYDEAYKLYFDELSFETVQDIYRFENPEGIILSMGGQIPNNIAMLLHLQNIKILGTSPEKIDQAENRWKFSRLLQDELHIDQPKWAKLESIEDAKKFCHLHQYPCLIRPSYVLSGVAMNVAYNDEELEEYLNTATAVSKDHPVVITKYIIDAKEIEVDAIARNGVLKAIAISEHVENAGVHSGDATLIIPSQDLTRETKDKIKENTRKIAEALEINGPFNIQFIAKDDQIKVIECNLRVSRTFPFVSKALNINFIQLATQMILGLDPDIPKATLDKIGVKVPQFSFNRLTGADLVLGVEMVSTGEVACFGKNQYEAYIKSLLASNFRLPSKGILLSIGSFKFKKEFLECARLLQSLNIKLYGTRGTSEFYKEGHNIDITELPLISKNNDESILEYIKTKNIDMVINISKQNKSRNIKNKITNGYKIRRAASNQNVPILTDIKTSKLFVKSLINHNKMIKNNDHLVHTNTDCFTSYDTVRLPGLIDVHVHVRDPGQTYKEDWSSCSRAALAGGITGILAMPNTDPAITDKKSFDLVTRLADTKSHCDWGIYVGAGHDNTKTVNKLANKACAMKMYLNNTFTGPLLLKNMNDWMEHIKNWPDHKPICVHAESNTLPAILYIGHLYNKHIHVCHVARKEEINLIKESKRRGHRITCEVSPHHLFLDTKNLEKLKCCGSVKPPLMGNEDKQALWKNMDIIDCFATDHAPHTEEEKTTKFTPGFPGLETALPLLLTAVKNGRLTLNDIVTKYHKNPKKIFNLKSQRNTYIDVDLNEQWTIPNKTKYTKCDWTPFAGMKVCGKVKRVVLRNKVVYVDGDILSRDGYGKCIIKQQQTSEIKKIIKPTLIPEKQIKYVSNFRHIVSVEQFTRDDLRYIFKQASKLKTKIKKHKKLNLFDNKVMTTLFYEPSTRTHTSFIMAMKKLGGDVVEIKKETSSIQKGESLEDTIRSINSYMNNLIVLRSSQIGAAKRASIVSKVPIINAGDGAGEHPTQALLDAYTIREEKGTVDRLTITMVGDLKHGRTVHSLAKLLSLYKNVRIRYVSPPSLKIPKEIYNYVKNRNIDQSEHTKLEEVLETTDVLYVTRIQKERFKNLKDYNKVKGYYIITPKLLNRTKKDMTIMHPLPRRDEISKELDNDPRAAYFRQMEYGMYIRMALLSIILKD